MHQAWLQAGAKRQVTQYAPERATLSPSWLSSLLESTVWIRSSNRRVVLSINSQLQNLWPMWVLLYSVKLHLWSFLSLNSFRVLIKNRHEKENKHNRIKRLTKYCNIFFSISITLVDQLNCELPFVSEAPGKVSPVKAVPRRRPG